MPPSRVVYATDFDPGFAAAGAVGACGVGVVHHVTVPSVAKIKKSLKDILTVMS